MCCYRAAFLPVQPNALALTVNSTCAAYAMPFRVHIEIINVQLVAVNTMRCWAWFHLLAHIFILRMAFRTKAFSNRIEVFPYRAQAQFIISVLLFDALTQVAVRNSYVLEERGSWFTNLSPASEILSHPRR